ncbi:MAG: hypothetical protein IMZ53_05605, partial [Thermoplasmata archaeon]|nr:hypothetical protein [Thermoplasmata archaeon]
MTQDYDYNEWTRPEVLQQIEQERQAEQQVEQQRQAEEERARQARQATENAQRQAVTIEVVGATTGADKYIVKESGIQKVMTGREIETKGGNIPEPFRVESEVHTAVMSGERYENAFERIAGAVEAKKMGMTQKELTDRITGINREEELQNFADKYGLSLKSAAKLIKNYNDNPDAPEFKKLNQWVRRDIAEFEGAKDYIDTTAQSVAWKKLNAAVKKNPNILVTKFSVEYIEKDKDGKDVKKSYQGQVNILNLEEAAAAGLTDPEVFNLVGEEQAGSPVPTLIKANKDDPGTLYTGGWNGVTKNQIYEILNVKREREEFDTLLKEKGVSREDSAAKLIESGIDDKTTLNKLGYDVTDKDIQSAKDVINYNKLPGIDKFNTLMEKGEIPKGSNFIGINSKGEVEYYLPRKENKALKPFIKDDKLNLIESIDAGYIKPSDYEGWNVTQGEIDGLVAEKKQRETDKTTLKPYLKYSNYYSLVDILVSDDAKAKEAAARIYEPKDIKNAQGWIDENWGVDEAGHKGGKVRAEIVEFYRKLTPWHEEKGETLTSAIEGYLPKGTIQASAGLLAATKATPIPHDDMIVMLALGGIAAGTAVYKKITGKHAEEITQAMHSTFGQKIPDKNQVFLVNKSGEVTSLAQALPEAGTIEKGYWPLIPPSVPVSGLISLIPPEVTVKSMMNIPPSDIGTHKPMENIPVKTFDKNSGIMIFEKVSPTDIDPEYGLMTAQTKVKVAERELEIKTNQLFDSWVNSQQRKETFNILDRAVLKGREDNFQRAMLKQWEENASKQASGGSIKAQTRTFHSKAPTAYELYEKFTKEMGTEWTQGSG